MKKKIAGLMVGAALVLAACGDDTTETTPADSVAEPSDDVTEDAASEDEMTEESSVEMTEASSDDGATATTAPADAEALEPAPAVAEAIISLSPTATEMLYAIGAGDQVLAVDDLSNYPEEAGAKMQGLSAFEPNVESIAGLDPDLVLTDGTNPDLLAQLDTLEIAHWEGPAAVSFDDVYTQIEQLGVVTGHVAEAAELVGEMQNDVSEVQEGLPALDEPLTFYHELDPTFFSATSDTFIGAVYTEIGLVNIADEVGEGSSYPQLNAEFIIEQNPDLIFLACTKYCGETAESLAARPGWESLDAIATGGVIEMDDDIASRWGPRIVDYLRIAGDAVATVAAPVAAG